MIARLAHKESRIHTVGGLNERTRYVEFKVFFTLAKLYRRVKEAYERVGVKHIFAGANGSYVPFLYRNAVRCVKEHKLVELNSEAPLELFLYRLGVRIALYVFGNKEQRRENRIF